MRPFGMILGLLICAHGSFYALMGYFVVGMATGGMATPEARAEAEEQAWAELIAAPPFPRALALAVLGGLLFARATWQTANEPLRRRGLRPPLKAETDRLEGSDSLASDPIPADWRPGGDPGT